MATPVTALKLIGAWLLLLLLLLLLLPLLLVGSPSLDSIMGAA
jgi:hypothetical protein